MNSLRDARQPAALVANNGPVHLACRRVYPIQPHAIDPGFTSNAEGMPTT